MDTEENLKEAELFISRLPTTYNKCDRAILEAVDADQWTEVSCIPPAVTPASKKRPNAVYRVQEQAVTWYGKEYHAIVVHSSAHDRRREKEVPQSLKQASSLAKEINKKRFFCRADAEQELSAQTTQYTSWKSRSSNVLATIPVVLRKVFQRRHFVWATTANTPKSHQK